MKKQIERIEIKPGADGSHSVTHYFKNSPSHSITAGIGYSHTDPETHGFGPADKEQHRMLTHIASALGFKKVASVEGKEDAEMDSDD